MPRVKTRSSAFVSVSHGEFDTIAVRIEHHALEVAVAGAARPVDDSVPRRAEAFGAFAHARFAAHRNGEVSIAARFGPWVGMPWGQVGVLHELEPRARIEAEEVGLKALGWVFVAKARRRAEVALVILLQALDVGAPEGDMLDAHSRSIAGVLLGGRTDKCWGRCATIFAPRSAEPDLERAPKSRTEA